MFAVGLDASYLSLFPIGCSFSTILVSIPAFSKEETKEIIFGSLLGDGKMEMQRRSLHARFGFIQSVIHKGYFLFVYGILSNLCGSTFRVTEYFDLRTQKTYTSYTF
jgi:hypothetical protein